MKVSIIVPAYNEEKRIIGFLNDLIIFSKNNLNDYEIILVNDGSTDGTLRILENQTKGEENISIISYKKNKGKGGAVREGILRAVGEKILFIDADGSIHPNQIHKLLEKLDDYDVVVGSRSLKESEVKMGLLRKNLGKIFNFYVNVLFFINIKDNLCGFKGFKKKVAKDLFENLQSMGWIFDVEIFLKIKKTGYSLDELPIKWEYKKGSKITILGPFKMYFQLLKLRLKLNL